MQKAMLYFFPIVIYLLSCASDQRILPLSADHKKYDLKNYASSITGETVVYRDSAGVILDTLVTLYEVQFDSVGNEVLYIEKISSGAEIFRKEWRVNSNWQKTGYDELWHNGLYKNYGKYEYADGQNIISEKRYSGDGGLNNTLTYTYDSKNRLTASKTEAEGNRPEAL
jgi:hypothetical protein